MPAARTVLLVDDEPDLVANCQRLLSPLGYLCLTAGTGVAALELIESRSPDLVVTDLRLPGVDGLAVARRARAHAPPIPVLFMTAHDSVEGRRAAVEAGAAAYLAKPFTNAAFVAAVRRLLGGAAPVAGPTAP